ncbi:uncharacterized protein LOC126926812 isoform X2 [Bombus affinis]|uniref:uncharacterized protein LOC126926795 isoform X3 n=1 Tax=Bombus affinis TaxID=309941 RepID=UPI0021B754C1|nr:uncharacterized protein LOC126926795 isoform X3 [Bombus affinis]XP_050599123.1 uncharacterized protein LOC126926800 isoform X2 [Bombus affinis]XP_050599150.1 uncharacterized protein LOC126926812 isoform X1 [Bombus affinis]XP_050599151.1 uncharacterized protein LOC126926812 isoform X2 [Bombus affinis]
MKWITVTGDLKGISSNWPGKTTEQKGSRSKSFRSNSFDVSTLHGAKSKLSGSSKAAISTFMAPSNWFTKRHQPMSKKPEDLVTASLSLKFDKSKVVKAVKETLGKKSPNSEVKHKVVWDNTSGTKVDAQRMHFIVKINKVNNNVKLNNCCLIFCIIDIGETWRR